MIVHLFILFNILLFSVLVTRVMCDISLQKCLCINEPRHEKPTFCICENKDADQLRGNREADQRLCCRYIDSTIPLATF